MKRVLILYATREGQTGKVAARIAGCLQELGAVARLVNAGDTAVARQLKLESFDLLVFGASMHAGGIEAELVEFINSHKAQISRQPRSFFLVLLSAATKDPELRESWLADARDKLDQQSAVPFEDVEMIAGALRYSRYSVPVKWIMQRIAKKAGEGTDTTRDYEYTDWQKVEMYSRRLAAAECG